MNNQNLNNNLPGQQPSNNQNTVVQNNQNQVVQQPVVKPKKKSHGGIIFLIFLILVLAGGCYYFYDQNLKTKAYYENKYSPVNSDKEAELELNSTIVVDLYNKFKTSVKEDFFAVDFNSNDMKLYMALRNVSYKDYLDSNCNMFDDNEMQYFTCPKTDFIPTAVDEEIVLEELKVLYGDNNNVQLKDVQLGKSCYGGYQYIKGRKQFVQGYCNGSNVCLIDAEKELTKAVSNNSELKLYEKVRYFSTSTTVPNYLKTGTYIYNFRLDNNYNYVLVSKDYSEERD